MAAIVAALPDRLPFTHLAFFSGWPNAMTAFMTAREQFAKRDAAG